MPRGFSIYDEARQQGRLWTPQVLGKNTITGWYDVSDKSSVIRTSSGLSQVLDKSGNGNHLSATSTAPTFGDLALGGVAPGVISQVAAAGLRRYTPSVVNVVSPTCALVVSQIPSGTNARLVSLAKTTDGADYAYFIPLLADSGTTVKSYAEYGVRATSPAGITSNRPFTAVAAWSASQVAVDLNGVPGAIGSYAFPSGTVAAIGLGIGAGGETGSSGQIISEAILVSSYLLNNQKLRALLTGYAAWKWASLGVVTLLADLSPANPFKNRPPLIGD